MNGGSELVSSRWITGILGFVGEASSKTVALVLEDD
jgi:hypothetical protein